MPTIAQAVDRNVLRIAQPPAATPTTVTVPAAAPPSYPINRTPLPTRGSLPQNIILATDFEVALGYYNGRLRARALLPGTLLGGS